MKNIKKALMTDRIRLSHHAKESMEKRGYTKKDLISCIMSGSIAEVQVHNGKPCVLVEGKDSDLLPIVLVIGNDGNNYRSLFVVITVMPPIDQKFKSVI